MNNPKKSKERKILLNQSQLKLNIQNIKSNYFLKDVFNMTTENKSLLIAKCNKRLQNRINISINNYKNIVKCIQL